MKLKRVIAIYEKQGDKFLYDYSINDVEIEKLKAIISANENDPDLFDVYVIGEKECSELVNFIPQLKELDFEQVELFYECYTEL
jgi:hypothetical protein